MRARVRVRVRVTFKCGYGFFSPFPFPFSISFHFIFIFFPFHLKVFQAAAAKAYGLSDVRKFKYLSSGEKLPSDNKKLYASLIAAMDTVGFSGALGLLLLLI